MSCKSNSFFKEGFQQNEENDLDDKKYNNKENKESFFTIYKKTKIILLSCNFFYYLYAVNIIK